MISVLLDEKLEKYYQKIHYTIDTIFNTIGFPFRFIRNANDLEENDILFCYSLLEPSQDEVRYLARGRIMLLIVAEPRLFEEDALDPGAFLQDFKEFGTNYKTPVYRPGAMPKPFYGYHDRNFYYTRIMFDLIGNVWFHLSGGVRRFPRLHDHLNREIIPNNPFDDYQNYPFINMMISLVNDLIRMAIEQFRGFIVRKCPFPRDQTMAAAISYNIDHLQKWNLQRLIASFGGDIFRLLTFRWERFVRSFLGKLKFILTNDEPWWNFEILLEEARRGKFRATWFWGVEQEIDHDVDYDLYDEDLKAVFRLLQQSNEEMALLGSFSSIREQNALLRQRDTFYKRLGNRKVGIRQTAFRFDHEKTPIEHDRLGFLFDSTLSLLDWNGFPSGIAWPFRYYRPMSEEEMALKKRKSGSSVFDQWVSVDNLRYNVWEWPVHFTDRNLLIKPDKTVSFDTAMEIVDSEIDRISKFGGFFGCEFNISLFTEIPFNKRLMEYTVDLLRHRKAWIRPLGELTRWWKARSQVEMRQRGQTVELYFPAAVESMTLEIIGKTNVLLVSWGQHRLSGSRIILEDVPAGTTVVIKLHPILSQRKNEIEDTEDFFL